MAEPDLVARTARVLLEHTVSLAGYQVMCSAGYRVTLPPAMFVSHAFCASEGDPRGQSSLEELAAAAGHHGVLRYVGGAAQPRVAADGPAPRR
jgi:hypothetical protein